MYRYRVKDSEVEELIELVADGHEKDIKSWLESLAEDAYNDGQFDGEEDGYEKGLESSQEVAGTWILDGEYDSEVKKRAKELGLTDIGEATRVGNDLLQALHSTQHPDSAYGWEFCGKCNVKEFEIR